MKLPNSKNSFIEPNKISKYLLNLDHKDGKGKAKFFLAHGFSLEDTECFNDALIMHSQIREVEKDESNDDGCKYVLSCEITTPDSRNPCIISVWMIHSGTDTPRFITAYPNSN